MQIPQDLHFKTSSILKIAGLALLVIIVIAIGFRLISPSLTSLSSKNKTISQAMPAYDMYSEEMAYGVGGGVGLSSRNYIPPINGGTTIGDDAEEFEVKDYNANIETRHLEDTCKKITDLKIREDVIFENANEYEKSCNYSFKVKKDSVDEILAIIEALDPKDLNESTYTIKSLIDDYTSEVEILEKKMSSIEETLNDAVKAYDDIAKLATKAQDVESLAKIIDSKIRIIERLTQERINLNAQLERLGRAKAEQVDRLEYIYFNVYVVENKFVDAQNLKDSWKTAVKSFVRDMNSIVQDITINLVSLFFLIIQYIIYLFIVLVVAKYSWRFAKNIWKK